MALKLLAPGEARDKAAKNEATARHRLVEVQTLITQKYKELGVVEKQFNDTLQNQRNLWDMENAINEKHLVSLRNEVEMLETRKVQALLPLTERAKELDTKASALDIYEAELDLRSTGIEHEGQHLAERLDEVAEREMQADKVSKTLTLREEGVQSQAAQVAASSAMLSTAMVEAAKESSARKRELDLKEAELKGKESGFAERERKVYTTAADFDKRELVLKDERIALTKAAEELKTKRKQ